MKKGQPSLKGQAHKTSAESFREHYFYKCFLDGFALLSSFATILSLILMFYQRPPESLSQGEVEMMLGSFPIQTNRQISLYLGANNSGTDGVYLAVFPICVRNIGKTTLNNMSVVSRFPKISRGDLLDYMTFRRAGELRGSSSSTTDNQIDGERSISTTEIAALNPGVIMGIDQPLEFGISETTFDVYSAEGVGVPIKVLFGLNVDFAISAANTPKLDFHTVVHMLFATNKADLKMQAEELTCFEMNRERDSWSWWKRNFFRQQRTIIRAYTDPIIISQTPNGRLYELRYNTGAFSQDVVTRPTKGLKWICAFFFLVVVIIASHRGEAWLRLIERAKK
jgi:hypothetical protein